MDKKELLELINYQFIKCNAEQVDTLFSLMDKTLEANEKFNLTAIKDRDQFVEKMIFDSALVLKDLELKDKSIIDIGTGAGFPGMVIAILEPEAQVTLLDSTNKKINHLINLSKELNVNTTAICDRAESFALANREKYDYATARAVAPLNILLELIIPILKVGGTFLAMKGAGYEDELNASDKALKKLSCRIESIYECNLPVSNEKRAIIRIIKDAPTNKKYPREYKEIKRLPL